jgi:HD domain
MIGPGPERLGRSAFDTAGKLRSLSRRRSTISLALGLAATAALLPVLALLGPESSWDPGSLLLALAAIAVCSYLGAVVVQTTALLDAGFVAALVALCFLGPLPAACIWIGTEVVALGLERIRATAFFANVASYGWAVLAGWLVLEATADAPLGSDPDAGAYAAVALAGLVMNGVNYLITRSLVACVRDGSGFFDTLREELLPRAPAIVAMTALGTLTAFGYAEIGLLALVLFALVVQLPQLALPPLFRPRPVYELGHSEAVAIYAQAIGRELRLTRAERLVLKDAAVFMRERTLKLRSSDLSSSSEGHRLSLVEAVLFHREHWDGQGGVPGAVGGEMIPLLSRVLAVADAWAGLTACGSPKLSHSQALTQLEGRAGLHFDPAVVAAAARVAERDRFGARTETAYQPSASDGRMPRLARRLAAAVAA